MRIGSLIADARISIFFDERMVVVGIHSSYATRLAVAGGNARKFVGNDGGAGRAWGASPGTAGVV